MWLAHRQHPGCHTGPGGDRFQRLRLRRGLDEFNLRVVVSGKARLNPKADVFSESRSPLIVLVTQRAPASRVRRLQEAGAVIGQYGEDEVDLPAALTWLARDWGVRRMVCEGGGELNDAMFRAGRIDEVHVTVCPLLFGGRLAPTICEGHGFPNLPAATRMEFTQLERVGDELFATLRVLHRRRVASSKPRQQRGARATPARTRPRSPGTLKPGDR